MMDTEIIRMSHETSIMSCSELDKQQKLDDNICRGHMRDDDQEIRVDEKKDLNPQVGMRFDSLDKVKKFYKSYAYDHGFDIAVRTSKKKGKGNNVNVRYHTFACDRGGKSRRTSNHNLNCQPSMKTECKAKLNVKEFEDGRVMVLKVIFEHNHGLSPGQPRNFKSRRKINWVKGNFELNDQAGNLGLGEGGAESLKNNFIQMQDKSCNEFGDIERVIRYDMLCARFRSLATIGAKTDGKSKLLMEFLDHAEEKMRRQKEICDGEIEIGNLSNMVESPKVHTKGCQRSKRKLLKEEGLVRINKKKDLEYESLCYEQQRDDKQETGIDEKDETLNPQVGMGFDTLDEAKKFYSKYASDHGFSIVVRNSKKKENKDETVRYHTFSCEREGKYRGTCKNISSYQRSVKNGCQAKINVKEFENGRVVILKVVVEHNHGMSPG